MSAIFISYRRDDSAGYAGRLFDKLVQHFGRERLFMDIENLAYGEDFVEAIDRAIASCAGLIVVIGPDWLNARDAQGRRRLDDPHDFISLEIAAGLKRNIRVIPVLVHGAEMPREADLPEVLQPLARRQATELSDNRWDYDVGRLAEALESLLGGRTAEEPPEASRPSHRSWLWVLAAIVVAAGGLAWVLQQAPEEPVGGTPQAIDQPSEEHRGAIEPATPSKDARLAEPSPPESATTADKALAPATVEVPPAVASPPSSAAPVEPVPEPSVPAGVPSAAEPPAEPPEANAVGETKQPDVIPDAPAQRIADLLAAADQDLRALRLTRPAGRNALARYRQVLALDPDNPAAQAGVRRIGERYRQLAEGALRKGDLAKARRHVRAAASLDPQLPWLQGVRSEIQRLAHQPPPKAESVPRHPNKTTCEDDCTSQQTTCTEAARRNNDPGACRAQAKSRCEAEYKACMNDGSKAMIWGPVAHQSECRQAEALCLRRSQGTCEQGLRQALAACRKQANQCSVACSN